MVYLGRKGRLEGVSVLRYHLPKTGDGRNCLDIGTQLKEENTCSHCK